MVSGTIIRKNFFTGNRGLPLSPTSPSSSSLGGLAGPTRGSHLLMLTALRLSIPREVLQTATAPKLALRGWPICDPNGK